MLACDETSTIDIMIDISLLFAFECWFSTVFGIVYKVKILYEKVNVMFFKFLAISNVPTQS